MSGRKRSSQKANRLSAETISQFIPRGSSVLVGLSGGADSVCLLRLLHELSESQEIALQVCHVNHKLRGKASDNDSEFCEALCDTFEVPFISVELDVGKLAKSMKVGLEEAGREARHFVFNQIAEDEGCDLIALGHTADDQIETALFRLFRGTGMPGLTAIPRFRGKIVRPLLGVRRQSIEAYLKSIKQKYVTDASNLSDDYSRNFIRNKIIPVISKRFPSAQNSILRTIDIVADESEFLENQAQSAFKRIVTRSRGGAVLLPIEKLQKLPEWKCRRVARIACREVQPLGSIGYENIDSILALIADNKGAVSLPAGFRAVVDRGRLILHRMPQLRIRKRRVEIGQSIDIDEIQATLTVEPVARSSVRYSRQKLGYRVFLDSRAMSGGIVVRSMISGDTFGPLGMRGSRKVGDFFTDLKVLAPLRGEIPIVCDSRGILWVAGYQIAERARMPRPGEKEYILSKPIQLEISFASDTSKKV